MKYPLFLLLFLLALPSFAHTDPGTIQEEYQININRAQGKIKIDGLIDEPSWQAAAVATNFWINFPSDGQQSELQTEVKVTYDDNFLYIAAKCFDNNGAIVQSLKRDAGFWSGDGFALVLDPVNQKTNGFAFGVSPYGVQMEATVTGNTGARGTRGSGISDDWDHKWYAKTTRSSDHWIAEIAIPFKTLRYDETKKIWGVNFIRSEMSDNSYHVWSPIPVQFRSLDLNYTGALIWDKAPKKAKGNITAIPYISGSHVKDFEETPTTTDNGFNVGLDAKVAVTSSLNLDVTINPDFSQVEVDEQVTNLTRFNIRLPEQRLFFLENRDVFENFGNTPARPFFSRRIGLDADGNSIPILYGLRLTGNATKNLRVGLLNMQTRSTDDFLAQNYSTATFHQNVFGRSTVKGYFINRQAMQDGDFQGDDYGRNAGLEFNYQSNNNKWLAWTGYSHSFKPDFTDENYYYKLGVRRQGRNFTGTINWYQIRENYFLDVGFLDRISHYDAVRDTSIRVGFGSFFTDLNYTLYSSKERKDLTSQTFSATFNRLIKNENLDALSQSIRFRYRLNFRGRKSLSFELRNEENTLLFPFTFTSDDADEPLPAQTYNTNAFRMQYRSDGRRAFGYEITTNLGGFYSGTRTGLEVELSYRAQPWGTFSTAFAYNNLQFGDPYGERVLYSISPKIEISFSNNLFWTTFLQYNTQAENFNVNSRIQWRFAPMSDIFLVYTDNYLVETDDTVDNFRISEFGPKNRAIVFKVNYWLSL